MNHLVYGSAPHLEPRRGVSLRRSGVILPEPGAGSPSIAVRARRRSLPRVRTGLLVGLRWGGRPSPGKRSPASSGVSPIAGAASRGIAFLVDQ